ncbi:MAG: cyclic nucleotide-binding domain-containing protein [archaeon]|nr:cyclic nucleotide-binding domain-containing protein [archaeon]
MALLYNAPRAATIKAKTDCVLWALDRECFNHIVKDAAMKKRERNENTLKKVDLLSTVDTYELGQIADALKSKKVAAGENIITQGEEGNEFYILEEGKAFATKTIDGKEEKVLDYEPGSYFGELALLNNAPRAATVKAESECKLLVLERMAFKRLLGPLETLLQRNTEKYVKYMSNQ